MVAPRPSGASSEHLWVPADHAHPKVIPWSNSTGRTSHGEGQADSDEYAASLRRRAATTRLRVPSVPRALRMKPEKKRTGTSAALQVHGQSDYGTTQGRRGEGSLRWPRLLDEETSSVTMERATRSRLTGWHSSPLMTRVPFGYPDQTINPWQITSGSPERQLGPLTCFMSMANIRGGRLPPEEAASAFRSVRFVPAERGDGHGEERRA